MRRWELTDGIYVREDAKLVDRNGKSIHGKFAKQDYIVEYGEDGSYKRVKLSDSFLKHFVIA